MKFVLGITTCDRLDYLKITLETWLATRNPVHDWHIIVADDSDNNDTLLYLASLGWENLHILRHPQMGVHHQTNRILLMCLSLGFDFGFKIDDDLVFKKKGWDDAYCKAAMQTGWNHLVFHDPRWYRKVRKEQKRILDSTGLLQNEAHWRHDLQGAFWTFTPKVLQTVGFFDVENFGANGFGHRDFTFRCCKAGFNVKKNIYDVANSGEYLQLNLENYHATKRNYRFWNDGEMVTTKGRLLEDDRVYVPYRFLSVNQSGRVVWRHFL